MGLKEKERKGKSETRKALGRLKIKGWCPRRARRILLMKSLNKRDEL